VCVIVCEREKTGRVPDRGRLEEPSRYCECCVSVEAVCARENTGRVPVEAVVCVFERASVPECSRVFQRVFQ
jgi:hypothetical protein